MKKNYTLSEDLSKYDNHDFDEITLFDVNFTVEDQIKFLQKRGYEIKCLSFLKEQLETDEFYASKRIVFELVALKPNEELEFNKFLQYTPQNLSEVFKKNIGYIHKRRLLNNSSYTK